MSGITRRLAKLEAVRERLRVVRWHSYVVTDSAIARHVGVAQQYVSKLRPIIQQLYDSLHNSPPPAREVTRDGVRLTVFQVIYDGGNPDTEPPRKAGKA